MTSQSAPSHAATIVPVNLSGNSYDILVQAGSIARVADHIKSFANNGRFFLITDENVAKHWLANVEESLKEAEIECISYVLPAGEQTKSWSHLEKLTDFLLDHGVERADHLIALGGGVIGDLTGFAASIVKRGCSFIQIPTSLLAQVDSSVGGKTAINSTAGKNLVGAFHQPSFVLIDPLVLETLPARELAAGYAEVVKYGLINDSDFFDWCEKNGEKLIKGDVAARTAAIIHSVTAKAAIVADDEKELSGVRALLNLGHTFGHALEAETGFSDILVHGEGVAAGMTLAFHYSAKLGLCCKEDAKRVEAHLASVGLPHSLTTAHTNASGEILVAHMMHDKKMASGNLPFLLARGIGQTFLEKSVDLNDVAAFLNNMK